MRMELLFFSTGVAAGKRMGTKAGDWLLPVCFDSPIQRRSKLAFRPLSKATRETDAPEVWLSATSCALNSEVY
jgi:hypothetical protein